MSNNRVRFITTTQEKFDKLVEEGSINENDLTFTNTESVAESRITSNFISTMISYLNEIGLYNNYLQLIEDIENTDSISSLNEEEILRKYQYHVTSTDLLLSYEPINENDKYYGVIIYNVDDDTRETISETEFGYDTTREALAVAIINASTLLFNEVTFYSKLNYKILL